MGALISSLQPDKCGRGDTKACGRQSRMQLETHGGFLPGRRVQSGPWAELAAPDPAPSGQRAHTKGGDWPCGDRGPLQRSAWFTHDRALALCEPRTGETKSESEKNVTFFLFYLIILQNQTDSGILLISLWAESISMNILFYYYFISRCVGV